MDNLKKDSLPLSIKYRPKKINEIVGQEPVCRILSNSIKTNNFHHAYIFAGKYGCGKTSAARVFASCLNNPNGISVDPDISNENIVSILKGSSPDVYEIDAASNRSIDNIRDIKEKIKYAPIQSRYKFVIIDEAHQLTGAAAEAALKMIEEPPKNVIFILCTTDPQKLIETIHSRCMVLIFNEVHWNIIYNHLKNVANSEGISYEDNALRIIARISDGSVRNSLQKLQTIITYLNSKDEKVTEDLVNNVLKSVDQNLYFKLIDSILKVNVAEGMIIVNNMLKDGQRAIDIISGLFEHLRNLLIISTCKDTSNLIFLSEEESKKFLHQKNQINLSTIIHMIDLMKDVNKNLGNNTNPQILLEQFIIKSIIFIKTNQEK